MYIIDVILLKNIPRPNPAVFTYYYPKKIARFSLVQAPVGKKWYPALVVDRKSLREAKLFLRKSSRFTLKEITSVIRDEPVLCDWQFELASWMADYYWASLGAVLKKFVPAYLLAHPEKSYELSRGKQKRQRLFLFPDGSFFQKVKLPEGYARVTSSIGKKKEYLLFKKIARGKSLDIAGTKRALFAPFCGLKEIHIYEEADGNHKSWDHRPKYSAVRVAKKLAHLHNAKIIYHSSIPSLEMFHEKIDFVSLYDQSGDSPILRLTDIGAGSVPAIARQSGDRPRNSRSPSNSSSRPRLAEITLIDLTKEKLNKPFGEVVKKALTDCYVAGKQALLYLNRRGESRFLLCRDCGFSPRCPNCELSLVFHTNIQTTNYKLQTTRILLCHHCGYQEAPPALCSECGSHNIRAYGFGTQRVGAELHDLFPKAKILRLDSDAVKSERQKKELMEKFSLGANFLVATSMLVSTPIYPVDTLIALSTDNEANIPDFAQSEKLLFNLWRLKSWSKRYFFIQTYNPSSSVLAALSSGDWKKFYGEELSIRKALNYPPFSSIIKLTYSHKDEQKVREEAEILCKKLHQQITNYQLPITNYQFLGPAPAFLPKLKGKYRYNILMKIQNPKSKIQNNLLSIVPSSWEIDVDPVDSL